MGKTKKYTEVELLREREQHQKTLEASTDAVRELCEERRRLLEQAEDLKWQLMDRSRAFEDQKAWWAKQLEDARGEASGWKSGLEAVRRYERRRGGKAVDWEALVSRVSYLEAVVSSLEKKLLEST